MQERIFIVFGLVQDESQFYIFRQKKNKEC